MQKIYVLEDLDCAHCAAKIEDEVAKLDGVSKSMCAFLSQKLTVEAEESKMDAITKEIKKIVKKLEPDVTVVEK